MDINDKYKELTSNFRLDIKRVPKSHIPVPNERDYKRGYIVRYFVQKTNDKFSPIFEVNSIEHSRLRRSDIFTTTSLRWRISGPPNTIYNLHDELKDMGVNKSNEISIQIASDNLTKLNLYLPNKLQFHT